LESSTSKYFMVVFIGLSVPVWDTSIEKEGLSLEHI
jgi:hypothetical protein